ncbi:MFS family permease [Paenibacillus castaneae]|uniref:MFS transporter n=1 Tax=Paenibacillus castaneae TaxID=474957 RepID=UPI001FB8958A|nr:MFS transporter [Paenibacillus castaneae]NIK75510.1 MFS family permease [Paenibacillus castaneae]
MKMITEKTNSTALPSPSLWFHPGFLILFLTGGIISFGNKIYELALPLILYDLTDSAVVMSTMRAIEFLPNLLLAMFIGVLVDRVHKKRWSLWAIGMQIVVLLGLCLVIAYGNPSIFALYVCGFLLMLFGYAFNNARVGIVKYSLPIAMLTPANAAFNFMSTLIGIMGPVLTGLLLMLPKLYDALFLTAFAFTIAFIMLLFLRTEEPPKSARQNGFWRELSEGWIQFRSNRVLFQMTIAVIFLNATSGMADTTIIFFAKHSLKLDNAELGLVLASAGIGGLIGTLLINRLRRTFNAGVLVTITTLFVGLSYLLMAVSHSSMMLSLSLLLNGIFEIISTVCIWTFRQESTPHRLIGRISGITGSLFKLAMPFTIISAGWISDTAHPAVVFGVAALGNLLIFIFCRFSALWRK